MIRPHFHSGTGSRPRAKTIAYLGRYVLALLLFNLSACSSYQTVNIEKSIRHNTPNGVEIGSLVKVTTLDRKTTTFRVMDMNDEGLGGNTGFYRYADMKSLKVERAKQNKGDAAVWVWSILGLAALVALIANADSVSVCSPPCESPQP